MDISELGLKDQQASGVLPRFYMKYLQAVWFILFLPGKRNGISGYSPDIDADEVSDDEEVCDDEKVSDDEEEYCRRMDAKEQQMRPSWRSNLIASSLERFLEMQQTLWISPRSCADGPHRCLKEIWKMRGS